MNKTYYVTTPIYYVNDKPHIGHAYTNIIADVLSRFKAMDGYDVFFITGTDEHGQKVEKSAKALNKDPQQFVDEVSREFYKLTKSLNLSNNDFIRTTEDRHKKVATKVWQKLEENGYIYLSHYKGWYALRDESFYSEEELIKNEAGQLIAPTGAEVEWKEEECYFFKLSHFQEQLITYLKENPKAITPRFRYNEVMSFISSGLKDLAISRTSFNWGIPVPSNNNHVFYVWLDALTNYLTVLNYSGDDIENEMFQKYWENSHHIVGKDILRFHTVYWFAILMGLKLQPPKNVLAHGWWLNEGQKISKSLGNVIDPNKLIEDYGLDAVRYFFVKEINIGSDGDFSHQAMVNRINNELANEYGNMLQRTLSIINKSFAGKLTNISLGAEEIAYLDKTNEILNEARVFIDDKSLQKYVDLVWQIIYYGNSYINTKAPWKLIKENQLQEAQNILYFMCELLRRVSLLLHPIMPQATIEVLKQLNIKEELINFKYFNESFNLQSLEFQAPSIVFKKIIEEK